MATVKEVLKFIETMAPRSMKMDWDNVGLLCGDPDQEVTRILVALDPFEDVCEEAEKIGAQLIVTHHPLIFVAPKAVTTETSVGRCIRFLCRHEISAINAHTNLDCAPGGVNDVLAARLGLSDVSVIKPEGVDAEGREWGLLRQGFVAQQPLSDFLALVKERLGIAVLRYADGGKPIRKVAVGGGACASELLDACDAGCDAFVTSDVKYNQFWDASDLGITLIDAGHFYTENPVCDALAARLSEAFPEISVKISEIHTDCMRFF